MSAQFLFKKFPFKSNSINHRYIISLVENAVFSMNLGFINSNTKLTKNWEYIYYLFCTYYNTANTQNLIIFSSTH